MAPEAVGHCFDKGRDYSLDPAVMIICAQISDSECLENRFVEFVT